MQRVQRWLLVTTLWLLWGLFQSSRLRFEVPFIDWETALRFGMPDAVIWALLTPLVVFLATRFPVRPGHLLPGAALHLLLALGVTFLHATLDMLWNLGLAGLLERSGDAGRLFRHLMKHGFHWNVVIYLAIVGITQFRLAERRAMELRARLSEARLDALRMQLRPHFLFNTLHTISGFMGQDPHRGRRIIRRLGDLLRAALRPREDEEIALEEEIELVRAYLDIEQARFGERLRTTFDIDPEALRCAVPALVLQPLVENAVRHGIEPLARGGTLEVRARCTDRRLEISLVDDGVGLAHTHADATVAARQDDPAASASAPATDSGSSGIGLANTRARLRELYGSDHTFRVGPRDGGGVRVELVLPARVLPRPARSRTA